MTDIPENDDPKMDVFEMRRFQDTVKKRITLVEVKILVKDEYQSYTPERLVIAHFRDGGTYIFESDLDYLMPLEQDHLIEAVTSRIALAFGLF